MTVFMTHPDLPDHAPAATTQEAFDDLWAAKGWHLVEDETPDAEVAAPTGPPELPARVSVSKPPGSQAGTPSGQES